MCFGVGLLDLTVGLGVVSEDLTVGDLSEQDLRDVTSVSVCCVIYHHNSVLWKAWTTLACQRFVSEKLHMLKRFTTLFTLF